MNRSIVTVFRLAVLPLVIAVLGLVTISVSPPRPMAADDRGIYDSTDLARVDYSGLPAPVAITARDGARLAVRVYDAPGNTVVLAIHGSNHASSSRCATPTAVSSRSATARDQRDL